MILEYENIDNTNRYKLMSDTVIPRPIAWIVTEDEGVINAAPFSYFTPLSSDPATIVVSIGHKEDGSQKDSLANILKHKKATICFANIDNLDDLKKSAISLPKNESETKTFNIDTHRTLEDYPPMIKSSHTALFCDFYSQIDIPGKTVPLVLELKFQYIQDERINDKNHINLENIARCGSYFKVMKDI